MLSLWRSPLPATKSLVLPTVTSMTSPLSKEREFAIEVFRRGFTACSLERLADFFDATGVQSFDDLPLLEPEEWQAAFQVCC